MAGQLSAGLGGGGSVEVQEPSPTEEGEEPPPGSEAFRAEADAERFDRTYLARSTDWRIAEPTPSPAPFPLQVIPRVAFVINYNMVRDPDTGEWTPQNPFEGGGGGLFSRLASGTITGIADGDTGTAATGETDPSIAALAYGRVTNGAGQSFTLLPDREEVGDTVNFRASFNSFVAANEWAVLVRNEAGFTVDVEWQLLELAQP